MPRPTYGEPLVSKTVKIPLTMEQELVAKRKNFSDWVRKAWRILESDSLEEELRDLENQKITIEGRMKAVQVQLNRRKAKDALAECESKENESARVHLHELNAELKKYKEADRDICNEAYSEGKPYPAGTDVSSQIRKLEKWLPIAQSKYQQKYGHALSQSVQ